MAQNIDRQWREALEQSRLSSAERRERVLVHPDLVDRLAERPLALADPYSWSGWIPPRTLPEDACSGCATHSCAGRGHTTRANRSPFRQQLVDIAAEALRREHQPALDEVE